MIVFNLACDQEHLFEGWFASAEDFESQRGRGLVECPVCASKAVQKRLSAPRLNLGAKPEAGVSRQDMVNGLNPHQKETLEKIQALWMDMARQVIANTEDVGERFAEEARRIHYRESPERGIRGLASAEEAAALEEEGIAVASFPMPAALKGPMQ